MLCSATEKAENSSISFRSRAQGRELNCKYLPLGRGIKIRHANRIIYLSVYGVLLLLAESGSARHGEGIRKVLAGVKLLILIARLLAQEKSRRVNFSFIFIILASGGVINLWPFA